MGKLEPDGRYNINVKVVEYETLSRRKRVDGTIVEVGQALVGDKFGCSYLILRGGNIFYIYLSFSNIEQVDNFAKEGITITLRNAHTRVDRTGHIKLNVDIWGKIELAQQQIKDEVNIENNISKAEYEAIYHDQQGGGRPGPTRGGPDGGYSDRPKRRYN